MDVDQNSFSPTIGVPRSLVKQKSALRQSTENSENGLIRHKSNIRWDENNLKENEEIKCQLSV